ALGVGVLFVGPCRKVAEERSGFRIAARRARRPPRHLLEGLARVDGEAAVLALRDHQPSCQRVPELRGQREPPLVVELGRVRAEEHPVSACHAVGTLGLRHSPLYPTIPHTAPYLSNSACVSSTPPHNQVQMHHKRPRQPRDWGRLKTKKRGDPSGSPRYG